MFGMIPFEKRRAMEAYDPFRELEDMQRSFFGRGEALSLFRTDVKDLGEAFELCADLPGFKKEDINIDVTENCLTVTAERKQENDEKDGAGRFIRRERAYGAYTRSFDLSGIDASAITAAYNDGVLTLNLPKEKKAEPAARRLEIQ